MKTAERIVMVLLVLILVGGGSWFYFAVKHEQKEVREAVARGEYEQKEEKSLDIKEEDWRSIYPNTVPIAIGEMKVEASVADSFSERIKGLSNTPFLPEGVVKMFVFGALGKHSIWMKDMNYSLDIIWATENGEIVHIEENVSSESYPSSFESPIPAWYVVETNAGFVEKNNIVVGDEVSLVK